MQGKRMKHIVCYSGGVSSALVGAMVIQKFGRGNTIFLNHQINAEPWDVDRFEREFARFHGMNIIYANANERKYPGLTPASVIREEKAFAVRHAGGENVLCTTKLKTDPFHKWLKENYKQGDVLYYGFDANETARIQRRSTILGAQGYKSDYPLALWPNPLTREYLDEIGIAPPMQYKVFKHANCRGCIKGGQQHWLCVYVHDRKTYDEFAQLEEEIGHTILRDKSLDDLRPYFESIVKTGIEVTEHVPSAEFWATVKNELQRKAEYKISLASFMGAKEEETKPCECLI